MYSPEKHYSQQNSIACWDTKALTLSLQAYALRSIAYLNSAPSRLGCDGVDQNHLLLIVLGPAELAYSTW